MGDHLGFLCIEGVGIGVYSSTIGRREKPSAAI